MAELFPRKNACCRCLHGRSRHAAVQDENGDRRCELSSCSCAYYVYWGSPRCDEIREQRAREAQQIEDEGGWSGPWEKL